MNKQSQAIEQYRARFNRNMPNATGNGGFHNATGNLANNSNTFQRRQPGWNANGNATGGQSAPAYILIISNASASAVANFDVFGASQYLSAANNGATWSTSGNLTVNGVTISSGYPNVTYQQILTSTAYKPVNIGSVYIQSIAGSAGQVTASYQITSQTAAGELYQAQVVPIVDGYQFQAGITYNNSSFLLEPMTKLTWSTIYASAVFELRFFTAGIVDPANALNGGSVQNTYSKPKVITSLS